jgi:DNA-binding IscR family transcriptional regulator
MRLSLRREDAIQAMLIFGLNRGQTVVRVQTISGQQNIPKWLLEQMFNNLKFGGFIESKRGAVGG